MPHRAGFPDGILASWGKVELESLDNDSIKALAEGRRPTTKGYLIDFIGDFTRSAKEGLPIYRLSGGAGFVWVASFNQKGRGTLRLTAVDASELAPTPTPKPPPATVETPKAQDAIANTGSLPSLREPEKESSDKARIDAELAREEAEKARDEAVRAKADIEKAVATERAKVDAVLAQLEADKARAEAKARTMESVAYGATIGLIVLVVVIASIFALRGRNKPAAREHGSDKPETRKLEPAEPNIVSKTEPAPTRDSNTAGTERPSEPELTEPTFSTKTESAPTSDSRHSEPKDANSIASSSSQPAKLSVSPRAPTPTMIVAVVIAATLLYSKTLNPYEQEQASHIAESANPCEFRVGKTGMNDGVKASVIGWQENEHGAAAEIIGECVNRSINFKATVLGRDAEPTVELPWDDKLEDYRTETGKFMQVVYLPITVKINDDEPHIVKRLHEEPYRNVIRLVTLLSEPTPAFDRQQSMKQDSNNVSFQLGNLLSSAEKTALTLYYPDKSLKISQARRITVQFETSKGAMAIKIMMDDPAIQKLVDSCQSQ
jgi:hypothetical protein